MIIGTSVNSIPKDKRLVISSDISELGIKDNLSLNNIEMIGVPSDKVDYVKKIVDNDRISIVAVDGIDERFYILDSMENRVFPDEFEKVKEKVVSNNDLDRMIMDFQQIKEVDNIKMGKQY